MKKVVPHIVAGFHRTAVSWRGAARARLQSMGAASTTQGGYLR
ncbi:Hypothetical protein A7982_05884 [Minicystis rosea]|nr:Hypothetical protein A7982_05884 [Minicystis rosea]